MHYLSHHHHILLYMLAARTWSPRISYWQSTRIDRKDEPFWASRHYFIKTDTEIPGATYVDYSISPSPAQIDDAINTIRDAGNNRNFEGVIHTPSHDKLPLRASTWDEVDYAILPQASLGKAYAHTLPFPRSITSSLRGKAAHLYAESYRISCFLPWLTSCLQGRGMHTITSHFCCKCSSAPGFRRPPNTY